jgi:CBS domain-containing protein
MKANEIMTTDVVTVGPDTSVRAAAATMADHRVTSLPVVDEDGRLIGIVSEVDLIRDRLPRDPRSHLAVTTTRPQPDPAQVVAQVMTEVVECLGGGADTADVASLMVDNDIRAVPIVDGGTLIGIVSRRDLLRTLLRDDAVLEAEVVARLAELAGSERWQASVRDGVASIHGTFHDERQRDAALRLASTVPGVIRVHAPAAAR